MLVSQAAQRRTWFTQYRTSDVAENVGVDFLCGAYSQANSHFELILTVKMETRHPIEASFGSEFWAICNHCIVMAV